MTAPMQDRRASAARMRRAAVLLPLLAALSACTSGSSGPSGTSSSGTSTAGAGDAGGGRTAYAVPDSCAALSADAGATLPGPAVAPCWRDALTAHGSVRAWTSGPPEMEAEVQLAPPSRLRTTASDGRVVVVADGSAFSLVDGRWVAGVLNSEEEEAALAAATGEFATVAFSPQGMAQGVGECPSWRVGAEREAVALRDGQEQQGLVRLDCTARFDLSGATTSAATLWVREDWTPVRHTATLSISGVATETVREFADHGTAFGIPTPG
ncbi:hypothetical protein Q9R29_16490 [Rothia sp. ARF10]|nr:hypothetical protein [Rothia sp. ARF10]